MIKKEGRIPVNARVDVDYTGKKPNVKFGYTNKNPKKDAIKQAPPYIFLIAFFLLFLISQLIIFNETTIIYPQDCNLSLYEYKYNGSSFSERYDNGEYKKWNYTYDYNKVKGANFTCDNGNYSVYFRNIKSTGMDNGFYFKDMKEGWEKYYDDILILLSIFGFLFIAWVIHRSVTKWIVNKKWYQKWLPTHMAGGKNRNKKYYKFKQQDILNNVIVIPKFSNVELDYKTNGDFSKQLIKIKIREYRHNKYKKQKVGKLSIDNYTWYAVFIFKEKPKDGYLEVIYQ